MRVSTNSATARARSKKLPPEFYYRATKLVARQLLGKILCRRLGDGTVLVGTIDQHLQLVFGGLLLMP